MIPLTLAGTTKKANDDSFIDYAVGDLFTYVRVLEKGTERVKYFDNAEQATNFAKASVKSGAKVTLTLQWAKDEGEGKWAKVVFESFNGGPLYKSSEDFGKIYAGDGTKHWVSVKNAARSLWDDEDAPERPAPKANSPKTVDWRSEIDRLNTLNRKSPSATQKTMPSGPRVEFKDLGISTELSTDSLEAPDPAMVKQQAESSAEMAIAEFKRSWPDEKEIALMTHVGGWYEGSVPRVGPANGEHGFFPRAPRANLRSEQEYIDLWLTPFISKLEEAGYTVVQKKGPRATDKWAESSIPLIKTANRKWMVEWRDEYGESWRILGLDSAFNYFLRPRPWPWPADEDYPFPHFFSREGMSTKAWKTFEEAMRDQLEDFYTRIWKRDVEADGEEGLVVEGDEFIVAHPDGHTCRFIVEGNGITALANQTAFLTKEAKKRKYEKNYVEKIKTENGVVRVYDEAHVKNRWKKKVQKLKKLQTDIKKLRKKYHDDLKSDDPKTRATAALVGLMDNTAMRVGNDDSVDEFETFGATTLQKRHAKVNGSKIRFRFKGKKGVDQDVTLDDAKVAKEIRALMEGKKGKDEIFEYEDGKKISAKIVNRYLAEFDITAKDLRGFHANRVMKEKLKKHDWDEALELTAEEVGHEPKTLENQYLDPGFVKKNKPEKTDKKDDKKKKKAEFEAIPFIKNARDNFKPSQTFNFFFSDREQYWAEEDGKLSGFMGLDAEPKKEGAYKGLWYASGMYGAGVYDSFEQAAQAAVAGLAEGQWKGSVKPGDQIWFHLPDGPSAMVLVGPAKKATSSIPLIKKASPVRPTEEETVEFHRLIELGKSKLPSEVPVSALRVRLYPYVKPHPVDLQPDAPARIADDVIALDFRNGEVSEIETVGPVGFSAPRSTVFVDLPPENKASWWALDRAGWERDDSLKGRFFLPLSATRKRAGDGRYWRQLQTTEQLNSIPSWVKEYRHAAASEYENVGASAGYEVIINKPNLNPEDDCNWSAILHQCFEDAKTLFFPRDVDLSMPALQEKIGVEKALAYAKGFMRKYLPQIDLPEERKMEIERSVVEGIKRFFSISIGSINADGVLKTSGPKISPNKTLPDPNKPSVSVFTYDDSEHFEFQELSTAFEFAKKQVQPGKSVLIHPGTYEKTDDGMLMSRHWVSRNGGSFEEVVRDPPNWSRSFPGLFKPHSGDWLKKASFEEGHQPKSSIDTIDLFKPHVGVFHGGSFREDLYYDGFQDLAQAFAFARRKVDVGNVVAVYPGFFEKMEDGRLIKRYWTSSYGSDFEEHFGAAPSWLPADQAIDYTGAWTNAPKFAQAQGDGRAKLEQAVDQILGPQPTKRKPPLAKQQPKQEGSKPAVAPPVPAPATKPAEQDAGREKSNIRVTSPWGMRKSPITGRDKMHEGADLVSVDEFGNLQEIQAIASGEVVFSGWQGGVIPKDFKGGKQRGGKGFGLHVKILHPNGFMSTYAHMSETYVEKGQKVERGQVIGKAGATGSVTGPHLHIELKNDKGQKVDPMKYIK